MKIKIGQLALLVGSTWDVRFSMYSALPDWTTLKKGNGIYRQCRRKLLLFTSMHVRGKLVVWRISTLSDEQSHHT